MRVTRTRSIALAALLAFVLACSQDTASTPRPTREPTEPASALTPEAVTARCAELATFFGGMSAGFTGVVRQGGAAAWHAFVDSTFADSSAFVLKGTGGMQAFSLAAVRAFASATDTTSTPTFEFRPLGTHVALITDRAAIYLIRYAELVGRSGQPDAPAPHLGLESGTLVRQPTGWRILHRQNATDSAGMAASALSVPGRWECR
jgi:hypothetical protein